jgi:hypothetical protein
MWAYLPAIARVLPRRPSYRIRVDLDGVEWRGDAAQLVIGNTRRYASVASATPGAVVDDGRLDVAILAPSHAASVIRQVATLVLRKRPALTTAHVDRVGAVTIHAGGIIPLETDGGRVKQDKVKVTDAGVRYDFAISAQALTMLVPREYSGTLFQHGVVAEPTLDRTQKAPKHVYRVTAAGVDTLQAARIRDGRVVTIIMNEETTATTANDQKIPLATFCSSLVEGSLIYVKGERLHPGHDLQARELRLWTAEP